MTWKDRLKPGAYTGPDGTRVTFKFEDLSKVIPKKTPDYEFPDVDASFIDDLGIKGRRYPMRCFFSGPNHDIEAAQFENLLVQRGPGRLEHPIYGIKQVIPFGDITQNDKVKTEANQTVVEVTFRFTIERVWPASTQDTAAAVDVAILSVAFETQFGESIDDGTPGEAANFAATMRAIVGGVRSGLQRAEDGTARLTNGMNRIQRSINQALAEGIGTPLSLGAQLKQLALAPARSAALLKDKLDAYSNIAESLFSGQGAGAGGGTGSSEDGTGVVLPGVVVPGVDSTEANTFHVNNMAAQSMVLGIASAVSQPPEGQAYTSRPQVIEAIENLEAVYAAQVQWQDNNFAALAAANPAVNPVEPVASGQGTVDTGEAGDALLNVVRLTIRHLTATAFVLPPERVFITTRPRQIIELCAELYGDVSPVLDGFIAANSFTGDELILIPAGRRVVYYPQG